MTWLYGKKLDEAAEELLRALERSRSTETVESRENTEAESEEQSVSRSVRRDGEPESIRPHVMHTESGGEYMSFQNRRKYDFDAYTTEDIRQDARRNAGIHEEAFESAREIGLSELSRKLCIDSRRYEAAFELY